MVRIRHRVRLRFAKQGSLRFIGHRDLARVLERALRRAGLPLSMSEGFHPKARISFPSALALGMAGLDEVVEVELAELIPADRVLQMLRPQLPPGLTIHSAEVVAAGRRKAQPQRLVYEVPIPDDRRAAVHQAIQRVCAGDRPPVELAPPRQAELRHALEQAEIRGNCLRFALPFRRTRSLRPAEVLDAVGLSDLAQHGAYLTRVTVQLKTPEQPERTSCHEKRNVD